LTFRTPQRGATGVLIVALIVTVLVAIIAARALSRTTDVSDEMRKASAQLAVAAAALEGYAAGAQRLPCPARPDVDPDTGDEVPTAPGSADCSYPEGTLPWRTIGMRKDDAIDPWGRRLSYRVYTGNAGSLVQPGGVSMAKCDEIEPPPLKGTTPVAGGLGGLCSGALDPFQFNTTPTEFLAGKGMMLTDMGAPAYSDVAYVILSHGPTGLGGYTVSGAQFPDAPKTEERNNTKASGAFTIKAFSDVDTEANSATHFDDLLVYRRLEDLVQRIGLRARNWPEMGDSSKTFDSATVSAAAGATVTPGAGVGRTTLDFGGVVRASGLGPSSAPTELTYGEVGGVGGIGGGGGVDFFLESSANEFVRFEFTDAATNFGITLAHFGTYGAGLKEKVQLVFYLDSVAVGSPYVGTACNIDGGLASFTVPLGLVFNRVDVVPIPASDGGTGTGISAFLISEVKTCVSGSCTTSLDAPANHCP
jgi:type II secretory pathway pseudopilin PulG